MSSCIPVFLNLESVKIREICGFKLVQDSVISDKLGVLLEHFGVILDNNGVVWAHFGISNITQNPTKNRIFTSKSMFICNFHYFSL